MAKYEPKHTEDSLMFDTTTEDDTVEKHQDRLAKHRIDMFEKNNTQVRNDMLTTYEEYSEKIEKGSDDEQIQILSRFHQGQDFFKWMLGDFLMKIENQINSKKKTGYNSLGHFLEKNEDLLGFGRTSGFDYVKVRKNLTIEQFRRIGIRKAVAVASIPDPIIRDEFIKQASQPKTTEKNLKLAIAAYKTDMKDEKQVAKVKEQKKIAKAVLYNIKSENDHIIIKPTTFSVEIMQEALAAFEMQIKAWIKRKLDTEE